MFRIGIINYSMGNIGSVKRKLDILGCDSRIINDYMDVSKYDKLIFPGVGHFASGVENLKKLNFWDELNEFVLIKKKPILGICLGMQLMSKHSEEGDVDGFGWFDSRVKKFVVSNKLKFKIPHMGWNTLNIKKQHPILRDINEKDEFYFVHSYHICVNKEVEILTVTDYDYSFTSAIVKDNILGFQFHPEKSLDAGKTLLKNFVNL